MEEVIIIGGGIAGLSAATELLRNDCKVTLLEAKERFGGRIYTLQEGSLPIELGAEFIHGQARTLLTAIRAAELSTQEVHERNQLFEDGKFHTVNLWEKVSKIIHRINPRAPDRSFQQFVKEEELGEDDATLATGFVNGFHAARADRISAHSLLRGEVSAEHMGGSQQTRVTQGYAALVHFLANDIRTHNGSLLTSTSVKTIRWKSRRVEIDALCDGEPRTFKADAAVVTVPLGALKNGGIAFDPPLPQKQEAIDQLLFGNVIKVTLVFREVWWPKDDFGFIHAFDQPIPTWWSDSRGPMLTGWAGGPKADDLRHPSSGRLESLALRVLAKIFDCRSTLLRSKLVAAYHHNWARDPHIGGAYSYIPVNGLDLPKLLGAPVEEKLFFAGEATATDAQTGTVATAFNTGLRAAREVLKKDTMSLVM
jgi:monoamine oxidase